MDIRMVDLHGQYLSIRDEIDEAIQGVLNSTHFIRGPIVGEFECKLAGYLNGSYAHGVANGTDALQVAIMALGLGKGDEVITTPFTFIATGEAASLIGATPVFADIDPATFNIDPAKIEELITERTRAIIPVHLFGQPADIDPILDIAHRHGLAVIEDNAQSVGSTYKGRHTGFLGDIGTLSFFPSKNLGCYGDGGAVLTNDEDLYNRMKMVANHGSRRKYFNEIVGINSRLDSIQAAVLLAKLNHMDEFVAKRVAAADRYDQLLEGVPGVVLPHRAQDRSHVFHQYTVRITPPFPGTRNELSNHLKDAGIPNAIYYPVGLHQLPVFVDTIGPATALPETERACAEVLSLPMHTELTPAQQERIAGAIHSFAAHPVTSS